MTKMVGISKSLIWVKGVNFVLNFPLRSPQRQHLENLRRFLLSNNSITTFSSIELAFKL